MQKECELLLRLFLTYGDMCPSFLSLPVNQSMLQPFFVSTLNSFSPTKIPFLQLYYLKWKNTVQCFNEQMACPLKLDLENVYTGQASSFMLQVNSRSEKFSQQIKATNSSDTDLCNREQ